MLGPNCSGLFDLSVGLNLSGVDPCFLRPAPLAFLTQTGYAVDNLLLAGPGLGVYVHTGNEADVDCAEVLEWLADDPGVRAILLHLEGARRPRRLLQALRGAASRKPVLAFKAAKGSAGARAAAFHTGALAGEARVWRAALRQAGAIEVERFEDMLLLGHALLRLPPLEGERVGVLTVGGGWGVILSDALEARGLRVPELSARLQRALGLPPRASARNPVDLGAAFGEEPPPGEVLRIAGRMLESGEVDALVLHGLGRLSLLSTRRPEYREAARRERGLLEELRGLAERWPLVLCSPLPTPLHQEAWRAGLFSCQGADQAATALAVLREATSRPRAPDRGVGGTPG